MKVWIKSFDVAMELKNSGIELDVYSKDGKQHLGDLIVTKTKLDLVRREDDAQERKGVLARGIFIKYMNEKKS